MQIISWKNCRNFPGKNSVEKQIDCGSDCWCMLSSSGAPAAAVDTAVTALETTHNRSSWRWKAYVIEAAGAENQTDSSGTKQA